MKTFEDYMKSFLEGEVLLKEGLVSEHIYIREYACKHCGKFPPLEDVPEDLSEQWFFAIRKVFDAFEDLREFVGRPIFISSGYRCKEYQKILTARGYKTAEVSPHNFGVALDIIVGDERDNQVAVSFLELYHSDLRIGFQLYNHKFIHIDTAYLLPIKKFQELKILPTLVRGVSLQKYWTEGKRW